MEIGLKKLDVLNHVAAGDGALAAGRGAFRHVIIIRVFSTSGAAFVARLGAGIAQDARQHALPGRQLRRRTADFTTINAKLHRLGVILVPLDDKPGTVLIAGIAFLQAIRASLGAAVKNFGMFGVRLVGRRTASGQERETGRSPAQDSQYFSTVHNEAPMVEEMNCR
jgi:hypothetical protein